MTTQKPKGIEVDLSKWIKIKHSLTIEEMFLLYNALNNLVNSKSLYSDDMKPYRKLSQKIKGMIV